MSITPWLNSCLKLTRKNSGKTPAIAVLLVVFLSMSACSGGGGATNPVTPPPPAPPPALAITSSAPTAANEGDVYTYAISTTDPASNWRSFLAKRCTDQWQHTHLDSDAFAIASHERI